MLEEKPQATPETQHNMEISIEITDKDARFIKLTLNRMIEGGYLEFQKDDFEPQPPVKKAAKIDLAEAMRIYQGISRKLPYFDVDSPVGFCTVKFGIKLAEVESLHDAFKINNLLYMRDLRKGMFYAERLILDQSLSVDLTVIESFVKAGAINPTSIRKEAVAIKKINQSYIHPGENRNGRQI